MARIDEFESAYAQKLLVHVDAVRAQADTGIHLTRRAKTFAERLAGLQASFAKDLIRLAEYERAKLEAWKNSDGMNSIWELWKLLISNTKKLGESHGVLARDLTANFAEPLSQFETSIAANAIGDTVIMCKQVSDQLVSTQDAVEKSKLKILKVLATSDLLTVVSGGGANSSSHISPEKDTALNHHSSMEDNFASGVSSPDATDVDPAVPSNHAADQKQTHVSDSKSNTGAECRSKLGSWTRTLSISSASRASAPVTPANSSFWKPPSLKEKTLKDSLSSKSAKKNDPKSAEKKRKKIQAALDECNHHKLILAEANEIVTKCRTDDIPAILRKMEFVERARYQVFKQTMGNFSLSLQPMIESLQDTSLLVENMIQKMDFTNDRNEFVQSCLSSNLNKKSKLGELLNEYEYDLPVTTEELSARLQKEVEKEKIVDTRKAPEISENRLSVNQLGSKLFGGSLKDIMEMPENFNLKEPFLFVWLVKNIYDLDGLKTEGVFRLSPELNIVFSLQKKIENREFLSLDLRNITDSAHVPAELLKIWLRNLKEPIIDVSFYSECINLGNKALIGSPLGTSIKEISPELKEGVDKLLSRLDSLSIHMVRRLCKVMQDVAAEEKATKMDLGALSIVIAPSFIRNPSNDPLVQMKNVKAESKFMELLCRVVDTSSINVLELPALPTVSVSPDHQAVKPASIIVLPEEPDETESVPNPAGFFRQDSSADVLFSDKKESEFIPQGDVKSSPTEESLGSSPPKETFSPLATLERRSNCLPNPGGHMARNLRGGSLMIPSVNQLHPSTLLDGRKSISVLPMPRSSMEHECYSIPASPKAGGVLSTSIEQEEEEIVFWGKS